MSFSLELPNKIYYLIKPLHYIKAPFFILFYFILQADARAEIRSCGIRFAAPSHYCTSPQNRLHRLIQVDPTDQNGSGCYDSERLRDMGREPDQDQEDDVVSEQPDDHQHRSEWLEMPAKDPVIGMNLTKKTMLRPSNQTDDRL